MSAEEIESKRMSHYDLNRLIALGTPIHDGEAIEVPSSIKLNWLFDTMLGLIIPKSIIDNPSLSATFQTFIGLPLSLRSEVEKAIFSFYVQEIKDGSCYFATAQDQLDWEQEMTGKFDNPVAANCSAEIWPLVRFDTIVLHKAWDGERIIVEVGGEAAWDGEHGIILHFINGHDLALVTGHQMSMSI